ncbi:MAG: MFS transporter [Polyangia bacterium]
MGTEEAATTLPRDTYHVPRPTPRVYAAVAATIVGVWVVVMQVRLTGYALADIIGALGSSPDEAAWVNTTYIVTELLSIPIAGWLCARISTRRVFVPAAIAFTLATLAATQVTNINQLIYLRAVQGFTGGAFIPIAAPTFQRTLPYRHRLGALALYGIASSVPISLAPLIESYFVDFVSWRWLFVPSALLSAIAAALAAWGMPVVPFDRQARWIPDWGGTLLMPVGLGFMVMGIDQANRLDWFDSPWVVGMLVAGALSLLAFLEHEREHPTPYLSLRLLTNRNFVIAVVTYLAFFASMIAIVWALPEFLRRVEDFRPSDYIDIFVAMIVPQLLVPFFVVRASRRLDLRLVVAAGVAVQAIACLRTATITSEWAAPELIEIFALHGLGQGLFFTPIFVMLTLNIADADRPAAAAVVNLTRVFGNAVGVSVASTLVTQAEHLHHNMLDEYLHADGFGAGARLDSLRDLVVAYRGSDENGKRALALAGRALRREAFVLAYGDLFLTIGVVLLVCLVLLTLAGPISLDELRARRLPVRRST